MPKYLKVLDRIGNEIRAGCTYHFRPIDAPVTVTRVEPEGVIDPKTPGRIIIEISVPFFRENDQQQSVAFAELMQIVHPQEAKRVEEIVSSAADVPRSRVTEAIDKIKRKVAGG